MSTSVRADEEGRPLVEIPDATGRVRDYVLRPEAAWGAVLWRVTLARADGRGQGPHRVSLLRSAVWTCSCPDARFRAGRRRRACKHVLACRDLLPFVPPVPADAAARFWGRTMGDASRLAEQLRRAKEGEGAAHG